MCRPSFPSRWIEYQRLVYDAASRTAADADMHDRCPLTHPASLLFTTPLRSRTTWGASNVSALPSWRATPGRGSSFNSSEDDIERAVRASQFRPKCGRVLLYEDDLAGAGLGYTSNLIASLLLWAVGQNRILLEVPVSATWFPPKARNHERVFGGRAPSRQPRWCDMPPSTHQCYWQRLSHCEAPTDVARHVPPQLASRAAFIRHDDKLYAESEVLRFKLTWVARSALASRWPGPGLGPGYQRRALRAAARFLWRPRAWVRRIAECVMQQHALLPRRGPRPANFFTTFLRESADKDKELRHHGHSVVPRASSAEVSARVAATLSAHRIFVQSTSASALEAFAHAAPAAGVRVSYAENDRTESDEWVSRASSPNTSLVAAVNVAVASHAAAIVAPTHSSWTHMLESIAWPHPPLRLSLCCGCSARDGAGGNLVVLLPRAQLDVDDDAAAAGLLSALRKDARGACNLTRGELRLLKP